VNEKEIRNWYRENGLEYLPGDWDRRNEVGESASYQPSMPERAPVYGTAGPGGRVGGWIRPLSHERLIYEEDASASEQHILPGGAPGKHFQSRFHAMWQEQRLPEDREEVEAMEEFWSPYLHMLPVPKANLIWQLMNARLPQSAVADGLGITQQAVSKAAVQAFRDLCRLVAADEPRFIPPADRRRRLYEDEKMATLHVLNRYWKGRFGHNYIEED